MSEKLTIGLVCEGKTDFEIVKRTLGKMLFENNYDCEFKFLQPTKDASSGTFSEGGWRKVLSWCIVNRPSRLQTNFKGNALFDGDESDLVDLIFIQLDGDLCEHFTNEICGDIDIKHHGKTSFNVAKKSDRRKYLIYAIKSWLKADSEPTEYTEKCIPIPTIMSSESWMLAACFGDENADEFENPKQRIAQHWYLLKGHPAPADIKKLSKPLEKYSWVFGQKECDIDYLEKNCFCFSEAKTEVLRIVSS